MCRKCDIILSVLRKKPLVEFLFFVRKVGETTRVFNGVELPVYDRERTVCDCFIIYSLTDFDSRVTVDVDL